MRASARIAKTAFPCVAAYGCPTVRAEASDKTLAVATASNCGIPACADWRQARQPNDNERFGRSASRRCGTVVGSLCTCSQCCQRLRSVRLGDVGDVGLDWLRWLHGLDGCATTDRGFAALWLFSSRRQALILLDIARCVIAWPNVRAEAGPTAKRQARAADNSLRRCAGLAF